MNALTLLLRLVLAGVFAAAGLAKLADRAGTQAALRGFGVPGALTRTLWWLLPAVELAVAAALIPAASRSWGALAALALLLCFLLALAANLGLGRTPPCRCFGGLTGATVGASTLARTAALAVLAGALAALGRYHPGPDPIGWTTTLSRADPVTLVLALALAVMAATGGALAAALLAQNGRLLLRVDALERRHAAPSAPTAGPAADGLPVGAPAPAFTTDGPDGRPVDLDAVRAAGRPIVLVFSDPDCGPCKALAPDIKAWQRRHAGALEIVVLDRRPDIARAYHAHATPTAVAVAADGTITSPLALGAPAITDLITRTAGPRATDHQSPAPAAASPGAPRPRTAHHRRGPRPAQPARTP